MRHCENRSCNVCHSCIFDMMRKSVAMYRTVYLALFLLILLLLLIACVLVLYPASSRAPSDPTIHTSLRGAIRRVIVPADAAKPHPTVVNCTYHTCFDVYRCGRGSEGRISVYVYPVEEYVDAQGVPVILEPSAQFVQMLRAVADSEFYTSDPHSACLLIPAIDLLNQNNLRLEQTAQILVSLPWWNDGSNHLLFNMLPGTMPEFNTSLDVQRDRALLAGGGFSTWTYRRTYDVAIPVFNPFSDNVILEPERSSRQWLLVSSQTGLHTEYTDVLYQLSVRHDNLLYVDRCDHSPHNYSVRCDTHGHTYNYPTLLQHSTFCLVIRGNRLGQSTFSDCLQAGSIPVVVADSFVLPFSEVLDWKRAALVVDESDLGEVVGIVSNVTSERVSEMRRQVEFYWRTYFSSVSRITMTTLQIINDRVYPYSALKYTDWNEPQHMITQYNPLFLPLIPPKTSGFTAVILTYDRLESLFHIIHQVSLAPSLTKVLVIWNNQQKAPPQASVWPKISKPLKVVQTRHNKLSNRFYPYDEIETEAILALDDDILMLTVDELEFGYEVWRQYSDRLIGFPSRLHLWDNSTSSWRYESEWTSEISMVLTGAAFYHKYYNYLYTSSLPPGVKTWVDEHMNCEDIAFNFLVASVTGKAPIKVTPRQKFRCADCGTGAFLSSDLDDHMVERSECIAHFASVWDSMPLRPVEFRADPVLYRDNFPSQLKWFNDVGSL